MSLMSTIINTVSVRIKSLSNDISRDNLMIARHNNANKRVFIPNVFIERISLSTPAKMLKIIAHLNSKKRLAETTQIRRRSGFTRNILMLSRIVACSNPAATIMPKKIQFFTV